ncbi:MAG: hypothetical protein AB7I18_10885 [Candidatus Berkiella sp.]
MFERIKNYMTGQAGGFFATVLTSGFAKAITVTLDRFFRAVVKGEVLESKKAPRQSSFLTDFSVTLLCNLIVTAVGNLISWVMPWSSLTKKTVKACVIGSLYRVANNKNAIQPEEIFYDMFSGACRAAFAGEAILIMKQVCGSDSHAPTSLPMLIAAGVTSECLLHFYKIHALKKPIDSIQQELNRDNLLAELRCHRYVK